MKSAAFFLIALLSLQLTWAQGTVQFRNTASASYRLLTNNAAGTASNLMSGANAYRIALYVSTNLAATPREMTFAALATNAALAALGGYFDGGAARALAGLAPGTQVRFQLRVWTFGGGTNWEQAVGAATDDPLSVQLAASALGVTTLGVDGPSAGALFGTNTGQLSLGFTIPNLNYPPVLRSVPNGLSTFAVPYWIGSNTVAELLPSVPEGTQLYKLVRAVGLARWTINQFQSGTWLYPDETLKPGEAAFIRNPGNTFNVLLEGTLGGYLRGALPGGANLIGFPFAPTIEFFPNDGDSIVLWRNGTYVDIYQYLNGLGWIDSSFNIGLPTIGRMEGVMYLRNTPDWTTPNPAIFFHNQIPAVPLDSPVTTTLGCVSTNLVAQLWAGPTNGTMQEIGSPTPVQENGYLDPRLGLLRELTVGVNWFNAQIRVWDGRAGSFSNAVTAGALFGETAPFQLDMAGEFVPPTNLTQFVSMVGPLTPFPIQQAPTNTTVLAGGTAQFAVTMLTTQGYSFQWQRELSSPTSNPPASVWTDVPGATSTGLTLPAVTPEDAGLYRVVIGYGCTNRALAARLDVNAFMISRSAVRADGTLTFTVQSEAGLKHQLFTSENLESWTPGPIYTNTTAQWHLQVTNAGDGQRFFRIAIVP